MCLSTQNVVSQHVHRSTLALGYPVRTWIFFPAFLQLEGTNSSSVFLSRNRSLQWFGHSPETGLTTVEGTQGGLGLTHCSEWRQWLLHSPVGATQRDNGQPCQISSKAMVAHAIQMSMMIMATANTYWVLTKCQATSHNRWYISCPISQMRKLRHRAVTYLKLCNY